MNINKYIKECHEVAIEKWFYECSECRGKGRIEIVKPIHPEIRSCSECNGTGIAPNRNTGEMLMIIVSELSLALEAHRICNHANWIEYDKFKIECVNKNIAFNTDIKDTFEDEIADVFIRLFYLCGYLEIEPDENIYIACSESISIPEKLFEIIINICKYDAHISCRKWAAEVMLLLNLFCNDCNIPIEKHIIAKMEYNKTKKHKHGNEY